MKLKTMMETIKTKAQEQGKDPDKMAAFLDGILYGMTMQPEDEDDKKSA